MYRSSVREGPSPVCVVRVRVCDICVERGDGACNNYIWHARTPDGRHHGVAALEALGRLLPQPVDVVGEAHLCVRMCVRNVACRGKIKGDPRISETIGRPVDDVRGKWSGTGRRRPPPVSVFDRCRNACVHHVYRSLVSH